MSIWRKSVFVVAAVAAQATLMGCAIHSQSPIKTVAMDYSDYEYYDRAYGVSPAYAAPEEEKTHAKAKDDGYPCERIVDHGEEEVTCYYHHRRHVDGTTETTSDPNVDVEIVVDEPTDGTARPAAPNAKKPAARRPARPNVNGPDTSTEPADEPADDAEGQADVPAPRRPISPRPAVDTSDPGGDRVPGTTRPAGDGAPSAPAPTPGAWQPSAPSAPQPLPGSPSTGGRRPAPPAAPPAASPNVTAAPAPVAVPPAPVAVPRPVAHRPIVTAP